MPHAPVDPEPSATPEMRVARNNAIFRDANERILASARAHGVSERLPVICECADPACTTILTVPVADYERVRGNPRWFLDAPGHQASAAGHAVVVEENEGFVVVEKVGAAGDIAAALASRGTADSEEVR